MADTRLADETIPMASLSPSGTARASNNKDVSDAGNTDHADADEDLRWYSSCLERMKVLKVPWQRSKDLSEETRKEFPYYSSIQSRIDEELFGAIGYSHDSVETISKSDRMVVYSWDNGSDSHDPKCLKTYHIGSRQVLTSSKRIYSRSRMGHPTTFRIMS